MSNGFDGGDIRWTRVPGEGGDSITEARQRNHDGHCGVRGCTNPLGEGTFMGVRVCDQHDAETTAHLRHLLNSE